MVDVMPGAEPWSAKGADVGVLVLHGFTGNPVSVRPLAESLAAHGYAVEVPRLPGHGTRWQDLQKTTWRDWLREAGAAFEILRARTRARVIVGLSMGGALAVHLAANRPHDVAGLALVNPWVEFKHTLLPALGLLKWVVPGLPAPTNDIAVPGGDEKAYTRIPLRALASVVELQRQLPIAQVAQPLLVFTSTRDHTIDNNNSKLLLDMVGSRDKRQILLENSFHVATLDHDASRIEEEAAAFVRRVTADPGADDPVAIPASEGPA